MARIQTFAPDLLTAKGDKTRLFTTLAISGCQGIRIFGSWLWGDGPKLQPFVKIGTWKHSTTGEIFSLYDLHQLNPVYFAMLREVMNLCTIYGQILVFSFLDYRAPDKHTKYNSPFVCSPEAFTLPGGFYGAELVPYMLRYMRRVMYWADKLRVDMRWEIANEFNTCGWEKDKHDPTRPLKWYKEILAELSKPILNYEKDYTLPAIGSMIHSGAYREEIKKLGVRWCYHCIGRGNQISAIAGSTCWTSGDGFFLGTGDPDQRGRRGVGLLEVAELGLALKANSLVSVYELMCRRLWLRDNERANLDDFNPRPLAKLREVTR